MTQQPEFTPRRGSVSSHYEAPREDKNAGRPLAKGRRLRLDAIACFVFSGLTLFAGVKEILARLKSSEGLDPYFAFGLVLTPTLLCLAGVYLLWRKRSDEDG